MYSRVPPEIRNSARRRRLSAPLASRGPPHRHSPRLQSSVQTRDRRGAVPSRLPRPTTGPPVDFAPAAGAPPRRRSRHSDPSNDRQALPSGRQRAARRQSPPLSGPLSAFQTRGCTPGYPPKIRNSARRRRFLSLADAKRFATPASLPRTTIRHRRSVGVVAPASASRPRLHRPRHRRCKSPSQPLHQATQERFRPQGRDHSELPSTGSSRPSG